MGDGSFMLPSSFGTGLLDDDSQERWLMSTRISVIEDRVAELYLEKLRQNPE